MADKKALREKVTISHTLSMCRVHCMWNVLTCLSLSLSHTHPHTHSIPQLVTAVSVTHPCVCVCVNRRKVALAKKQKTGSGESAGEPMLLWGRASGDTPMDCVHCCLRVCVCRSNE